MGEKVIVKYLAKMKNEIFQIEEIHPSSSLEGTCTRDVEEEDDKTENTDIVGKV